MEAVDKKSGRRFDDLKCRPDARPTQSAGRRFGSCWVYSLKSFQLGHFRKDERVGDQPFERQG